MIHAAQREVGMTGDESQSEMIGRRHWLTEPYDMFVQLEGTVVSFSLYLKVTACVVWFYFLFFFIFM